jgi:U3 small nucleolar RNA-associated protein 7
LLIGGHKGHIAAFDWQTGGLHFETHVNETVRDVTYVEDSIFEFISNLTIFFSFLVGFITKHYWQ